MTDEFVLVDMAARIVGAYVSNNRIMSQDVGPLVLSVHQTLVALSNGGDNPGGGEPLKPAVPIKRSIQGDFIICLEDGLKFKSLKRHLRSAYGMTPEEYRSRWGLPHDYPMVAPNYAAHRSKLAKAIGLGRKRPGGRRR
jgi:MucR family transcriptional regulator, transcriptional regulator of exopolysaccharide biosynthesis